MSKLIKVMDMMNVPAPDAVKMSGLVGRRFDLSRRNRLQPQEEDHLLWPFHEHCAVGFEVPGRSHPEIRGDWQGEFIGTWLDAAVLSAWNAGDGALRAKIDAMVKDWLSTQEEDGYLGTYNPEQRWQSWDVWIHAHDIIGLLSYYRLTGDAAILNAAIRAAECVMAEFGPGKRPLHASGPQCGMASSAFLEPLLWLYKLTGKESYLAWGRWLVEADWEAPDGPKILSSLLSGRGVAGTGNAKGVEMLTNFAGLAEFYRVTGEKRCLEALLAAWEDIVAHQLYITGTASTGEFFTTDYLLRNDGVYMIGETCVSMAWLYLNLNLGRLTGEARFFDMAEQTLYNHLLAAQSPDGKGWAYYVGLRDHKRYRWHTDPECCPSRGVRALAQMPTHVFGVASKRIYVNFYEPCNASLVLPDGQKVDIKVEGNYPFVGNIRLVLDTPSPDDFAVHLRLPGWCKTWQLFLNNDLLTLQPDQAGYLVLERRWKTGEVVELKLDMPARLVVDVLGNRGHGAVTRGPLVYAADSTYLPEKMLLDEIVLSVDRDQFESRAFTVSRAETGSVHLLVPCLVPQLQTGAGLWREHERYYDFNGSNHRVAAQEIEMVPFYEAGNREADVYQVGVFPNNERVQKVTYQVWLPYQG